MNAEQVVELISLAIQQVDRLIERGIGYEEALRRVQHLTHDVAQIDADVDEAAAGR